MSVFYHAASAASQGRQVGVDDGESPIDNTAFSPMVL